MSGTFDVLVHSKGDNLTRTHTIRIDLDGMDEDTTLTTLAQQLDSIDGISAPGLFVEMVAEMDLIAVVSNCPQINNPCNGFNPTPVRMVISG